VMVSISNERATNTSSRNLEITKGTFLQCPLGYVRSQSSKIISIPDIPV
jgi:hypothetical protein